MKNMEHIGNRRPDLSASAWAQDQDYTPVAPKPGRTAKRKARQNFWNQKQPLLNIASLIVFCVGCLMMITSQREYGRTQLIMKYPTDHTDLAVSMVIKDGKDGGKNRVIPKKTGEKRNSGMREVMVELESFGNLVPLLDALNLTPPRPLNYSTAVETKEDDQMEDNGMPIRMFVGITSACCNRLSQERRKSIRDTWKSYALERFPNVDIKFFLAQPGNDSLPYAISLLEDEVAEFDDIVVVPGLDVYNNLPKKTIGLLRYVNTSPTRYTHVLKTDDDCYVRMHKIIESLRADDGSYMMKNLYMGCEEAHNGFQPIRDPNSKWYISLEVLPDEQARLIWGTKYFAGWGYILSQDVVDFALSRIDRWDLHLEPAPYWYKTINWEDVMMGLLLKDAVDAPVYGSGFKAAWRACTNQTSIRHLDIDSPRILAGLHEQQVSGLWDQKTVQCSSGDFMAGDYKGWKAWRNSVTPPGQRI